MLRTDRFRSKDCRGKPHQFRPANGAFYLYADVSDFTSDFAFARTMCPCNARR